MSLHRERERRFLAWSAEYGGIFRKFTCAYASEEADQADLFQEMSIQLWQSLDCFRGQCQPSTWVYRVCLNTALGWVRGQRRRPAIATEHGVMERLPAVEPRPGWTQEEGELLERIYAAIRGLPAGERSVMLLSLEEMSYRQMAEITGLTEANIGVMLTRARVRLAEKLKEVRDEL